MVGRPSLPLAFRQQGGQTHNKTHVHTLPQILGSTGQKTTQGEAGVPGGRFYAEEQTPPPPREGSFHLKEWLTAVTDGVILEKEG